MGTTCCTPLVLRTSRHQLVRKMALNSTQVVAKAQTETRGNFHSIQVMLGFQHADLNFPTDFQQQEEAHQDVGATGTNPAGTSSAAGGWPSCAQQNSVNNTTTSVTSTTGKKSDSSKSAKKNSDTNNHNNNNNNNDNDNNNG